MKTSKTSHAIYSTLTLAIAMVMCSSVQAESATSTSVTKTTTEGKTMENCQTMHADKQKMLDEMKVQDAELTDQLAKMNAAPDDKKVGLMAVIVTHMVEQRVAMDVRKAKMEEMMCMHMGMGKDAMMHHPAVKAVDKK